MGMGMGVGVGRKGKVILRVVAGGARLHSVKFIRGEGGMGGGRWRWRNDNAAFRAEERYLFFAP